MKDRAEFQTLMKLCCHRKVDLILVKSFSRLGRNMLDILRALRELRDLSVDVCIREETCGSTMREWRCWSLYSAPLLKAGMNTWVRISDRAWDKDSEWGLPAMWTLCSMDTNGAMMVDWLLTNWMLKSSAEYSKWGWKGKVLVRYLTGSTIERFPHLRARIAGVRKQSANYSGTRSMQRYAALEDICEKCADGQAVRKLQRVGAVSHTTASSEDCELKTVYAGKSWLYIVETIITHWIHEGAKEWGIVSYQIIPSKKANLLLQ